MKTKAKQSKPPKRKQVEKRRLHLNTTFEDAIDIIVGSKKPTKAIVKMN